jgi:hypothetical protein
MTYVYENTRHITTPDDPSRVWKVRRIGDGRFKQIFNAHNTHTDEDRWGHRFDRLWIVEEEAEKQAAKEKFPCEAVAFRLVEITE